MQTIPLLYTPGQPYVYVRPLCGRDEMAIVDGGTYSALNLINGLLDHKPNMDKEEFRAEKITTADRDQLMANLYKSTYGSKIESTINCSHCSIPFDLDFSLDGLMAHLKTIRNESKAMPLENGSYQIAKGCQFRLPTGEDELAVIEYLGEKAGEVLLERCLLEGDPQKHGQQVEEAMSKLAPVLQTEMKAFCPECEKEQQVRFDIQSFFLNRLKSERKQTSWEIHRLATSYQWSHNEILDLPRNQRQMYVRYIESEG